MAAVWSQRLVIVMCPHRLRMTSGMVAGRGFFPGKGGRRGFPLIGDEFGYFHDKPYHDFGYPNFPPPPDGFFPPGSGGPMGFLGPPGACCVFFNVPDSQP